MTISKEAISKAKPGTALHDKQIVGLGLYFGSRSASWKYCYRVRGTGKQRRPKIGNYPELSIRDAREIVREYAVAIARGEDPFIKREVKTLEYVYEKFVIAYTGKLKPGTLRTYQNQWEVHIPQSIKRSDIRDIKRVEPSDGIPRRSSTQISAFPSTFIETTTAFSLEEGSLFRV